MLTPTFITPPSPLPCVLPTSHTCLSYVVPRSEADLQQALVMGSSMDQSSIKAAIGRVQVRGRICLALFLATSLLPFARASPTLAAD